MGDQYKPVVFYCGTVKPRLLVVSRFFFCKVTPRPRRIKIALADMTSPAWMGYLKNWTDLKGKGGLYM